jgi:hypothetical protein
MPLYSKKPKLKYRMVRPSIESRIYTSLPGQCSSRVTTPSKARTIKTFSIKRITVKIGNDGYIQAVCGKRMRVL